MHDHDRHQPSTPHTCGSARERGAGTSVLSEFFANRYAETGEV